MAIDIVLYMSSPQAMLQYEDITLLCTCHFPQIIMVLSIIFWFKVDYCFATLSYDGLVIWRYHSAMYLPFSTDMISSLPGTLQSDNLLKTGGTNDCVPTTVRT